MDAATREFVWERARGRCEYCRLHQDDADFLTFHVEHILAEQHGGSNAVSNLCLSCPECNLAKGPNLSGYLRGKIVPLFHPRRQAWERHFYWRGPILVGRTLGGPSDKAVSARSCANGDGFRVPQRWPLSTANK